MALMRREAFAIRGLPVPEIPAPAPPVLLPVTDAGAISWQGSVGATGYVVERAPEKERPLDEWPGTGLTRASPSTGPCSAMRRSAKANGSTAYARKTGPVSSSPSNVSGPVEVASVTFVDELADFSKVHSRAGRTGDQVPRLPRGDGGRAPRGRPGRQQPWFTASAQRSPKRRSLCSSRRRFPT